MGTEVGVGRKFHPCLRSLTHQVRMLSKHVCCPSSPYFTFWKSQRRVWGSERLLNHTGGQAFPLCDCRGGEGWRQKLNLAILRIMVLSDSNVT